MYSMKHPINQDNYYEDLSFGSPGILIFRLLISLSSVGYFICIGINLWLKEPPGLTEQYMGITGSVIFFFGMFLFLCSYIRFASQTIKK